MIDFIKSDPIQGNFDIKSLNYHESSNIFGNKINQKFNNWLCKKYEFKVTYEYSIFKKGRELFKENLEEYGVIIYFF